MKNNLKIKLKETSKIFKFFKFLRSNWKVLLMIGLPIALLPLAVSGNKPMQCGFIIVLVAIYWLTEVMNIAVASLLPLILFPAFNILDPKEVTACYMKDITLMLIGGLTVSKAIEKQRLHKRLALAILSLMGPNPVFQYFGFMFSTWFTSMWISNTSSTAMMITLASAVNEQWLLLNTKSLSAYTESNTENVPEDLFRPETDSPPIESYDLSLSENEDLKAAEYIGKGLLLSIAYSATCGGMATIPGTPPNLVFYGLMETLYGSRLKLNFGSFMLFSLPISLLLIIICWILLLSRYVGIQNTFQRKIDPLKDKKLMDSIRLEMTELGPISYAEFSTFGVFITLILLWVLRDPGYPLLGSFFTRIENGKKIKYWTDGISAILATLLVFNLPSKNPFKRNHSKRNDRLIDWQYIERGFSWGIVFLFGGGFALAAGCEKSGLSEIIGDFLTYFTSLPHYLLLLLISLGISFLTEFTSNVVTATILLPILVKMAECIDMHPMRMGLTVTLSCSFSFCLPAATPPNAIVISTGKVQVIDMVTTGFLLNIICVFVVSFMAYYWSCPIFTTDVFPNWIKVNCTRGEH